MAEQQEPFFILHKGSARKPDKVSKSAKRRIDLFHCALWNGENPEAETLPEVEDQLFEQQRMEAFELVWSKIESTFKDVLRNMNAHVFDEIELWVRESFDAIRSYESSLLETSRLYPVATDVAGRQLFTGLVLTKNMEFIDDLLTFEELHIHLKSHDGHVANLSSLDFTTKNGIGGCLRTLLRQILKVTVDSADLSVLASWYSERGNNCKPVVVIIEDIDRCCGSVLSDFILMLSEWVIRIPVILIMGSATLDSLRSILPSNSLQRLRCFKFILGSPAERMDAVVKSILVKPCSGFKIGHGVAVFMRHYFLRQDGTLISFMRALKIACLQHFLTEPLSLIFRWLNSGGKDEVADLLPKAMYKYAAGLPSASESGIPEMNNKILSDGLLELERLQKEWSPVLSALIGDARKMIQVDLLEFHKIIRCCCCSGRGNAILPSMHDTSILYVLAQEHGDLINLHDWYQSFKSVVLQTNTKQKNKSKVSPSPRKRKHMRESQNQSEATLQARFCRAVTELQITGLLRMPTKRRPDFALRVAFGL